MLALFFIVKGGERGNILFPCTCSYAAGCTAVSLLLQRCKNHFIAITQFGVPLI